jgi:hypothetical protein
MVKGCIPAYLIILLTTLWACDNAPNGTDLKDNTLANQQETNKTDSIVFLRFEKDLFGINLNNFQADTTRLRKKYGSFTDLYFNRIIRIGNPGNPMFQQNLGGFLQDPDIRSVYQAIQTNYPNLDAEKKQLEEAFGRYRAIFPDSLIPHIYTMLSGFSYNIVTADSALAIGLDMYLGADSRFYELLTFPKYKSAQMHRGRMVCDAIRAYLLSCWEMDDTYHDLVTRMIYQGKIYYLEQMLLPQKNEADILGYTAEELKWCYDNEARIWSHFIDRKLFFSTDFNNEVAYINDGPFTKGFPEEAPARIGVWLGLQLVKSYMDKNEADIHKLMQQKDARLIFSKSKYKPGRA